MQFSRCLNVVSLYHVFGIFIESAKLCVFLSSRYAIEKVPAVGASPVAQTHTPTVGGAMQG